MLNGGTGDRILVLIPQYWFILSHCSCDTRTRRPKFWKSSIHSMRVHCSSVGIWGGSARSILYLSWPSKRDSASFAKFSTLDDLANFVSQSPQLFTQAPAFRNSWSCCPFVRERSRHTAGEKAYRSQDGLCIKREISALHRHLQHPFWILWLCSDR